MDEITMFQNIPIAAGALFIVYKLGISIIDMLKNRKDDYMKDLCEQMKSFTNVNQELVKILTKSVTTFEKDQKELLSKINQLFDIANNTQITCIRIDERTEACNKNKST